jgi:TolA-binding protein
LTVKTSSLLTWSAAVVLFAGLAQAQAKKADKKVDAGVVVDAGVLGPSMPAVSPSGGSSEAKSESPPAEAKPKTRYYEGMGRTEQEKRLLEEVSQALSTYEEESREFKREVQLLIEKKYEEKRNTLGNSYEKAIRDLEVLERKERLDAISAFEEFLTRYPNDARYTPDVMFRLAELYYERSSDDHTVAMRDYEESLKKLDPEKNPTPPPEPHIDFTKSIALYQRLITDFPSYKLNDASYYLLGYCEEKQEKFENAKVAYEKLIAAYPKSKFTIEAWVRLGEYYFDAYDIPDALPKAADAYEHAIADITHPLYDKALYKLGWVYYRMDRFDDSVSRFFLLADFYQAEAKKKGDDEVGGDLRAEALQYTAISFVDEKWGSLAKAQEMFAKIGGRPLRGRDLPPHGRRLLRSDEAPGGDRGVPARAAEGPAQQGRAPDSAAHRSGLRARPQARGGVRRVVEARQHVRAGHAVAREVETRPRRGERRRRPRREEPLLDGDLPPPAGARLQAGAEVRAGEVCVRDRCEGVPVVPGPLPRARRTPTRWSSTGPSVSTTRSSSPRPPSTTPRCATRART